MTIESTINRTVAATNGATTVFPFGYYFLTDQDIIVLKTETATGVVATLVLNSDYTVTGAADPAGGNVTIAPALASGFKITIYRDPEAVQPLDLVPNDPLPAGPVEQAFDRITMIVQRLRDLIDRSFRLNDGDTSGSSLVVPTLQAGQYVRVAVDGMSLEFAEVVPSSSVVSASETVAGIGELATDAEMVSGTAGKLADAAKVKTSVDAKVAAVTPIGKHMVPIMASGMIPATTNGAASGTVETTTNKVLYKTLDFDTATQEFAGFVIPMPKSWNEGTVTFVAVWTAASGSGGVAWALQGLACSDDDAIDTAYGTEQVVTDTLLTAGDVHRTAESAAVTIAGTPAASDTAFFRVKRVPANGSDTLGVDARLIAVELYMTTDAATDA